MIRVASIIVLAASVVGITALNTPHRLPSDALRWSSFVELQRPRAFASVLALPTGEILIVGGLDKTTAEVTNPKTELIDPASGTVSVLPQTILARLHQTVSLASTDEVVVAGGVVWQGTHWEPVDRVDVYDVKLRTWRTAAPLHAARSDAAAVTLRDGRVAVFGGNFDTRLLSSVEIYDPARDVWEAAASMPRPRTQHTAVLLKDGRALIAGGIDSDGGPTDSTFLYDPTSDSWQLGPRMTQPRFQQATVTLRNGDVLFIGGDDAASGTSELYLASEGRFTSSGTLTYPRLVAQAAALPDGRVVVAGGLPPQMTMYRPLDSVEIWDPQTRTWTVSPGLADGRAWGALLRVDGALYLVSGTGDDDRALQSVERLAVE